MATAVTSTKVLRKTFGSQDHEACQEFRCRITRLGKPRRMTASEYPATGFMRRTNEDDLQTHGTTSSGAFFMGLSPDVLEEFESMAHNAYYEDGSLLFSEGQFPESVYVVIEGSVKLSMNSTDGRRLTHRVASRGEIVGMTAVILDMPYDSTAEAIRTCKIASISKREFFAFLLRHPETQAAVMKALSVQYTELCDTLRLLNLSSKATKKIARLLLNWSSAGEQTGDVSRLRFFLTHEEIGQFVGASRETVTRTLTEFKQKRLIEQHGSVMTIPNKPALEKIAEA